MFNTNPFKTGAEPMMQKVETSSGPVLIFTRESLAGFDDQKKIRWFHSGAYFLTTRIR